MNETEMNAVEYYHSLMEINHPFVLQKTIEENSEVFPINKVEDVANMNEIIYKVILLVLCSVVKKQEMDLFLIDVLLKQRYLNLLRRWLQNIVRQPQKFQT